MPRRQAETEGFIALVAELELTLQLLPDRFEVYIEGGAVRYELDAPDALPVASKPDRGWVRPNREVREPLVSDERQATHAPVKVAQEIVEMPK